MFTVIHVYIFENHVFMMIYCYKSPLISVHSALVSAIRVNSVLLIFQGYNSLIVFSRPFYFCLVGGLMLVLDYVSQTDPPTPTYVYGLPFTVKTALWFARDFLKGIL